MPLTNVDAASVPLIRQELASMMVSITEIDLALQSLGAAASIVPSGTLDFSHASNSDLIAVIAA